MNALFVARTQLTSEYSDWLLAGLESGVNSPLRKPIPSGELTLADAEAAMALWGFAAEQQRRHQIWLQALSRGVQSIAHGLARPLYIHTFDPLNLCEGFRLQVRTFGLPAAGQILLGELFQKALESRLEALYANLQQVVSKSAFANDADRPDVPEPAQASPSAQPLYHALEQVIPLFRDIERNAAYSAASRRLLLSLKPALVLLAVADGQAFANAEHPGKRLLTKLITGWQGVLDAEDPRHKSLTAIVKQLIVRAGDGAAPLSAEIQRTAL